jgi:hypothetical protein
MSAHEQVNIANLENQAFALMARLHVILRREKGRVTDIEYMRNHASYCRHVLGLIDVEDSQEVRDLGARLDEIFFGQYGLFIRKRAPAPLLARFAAPPPVAAAPAMTAPPPAAASQKYVGRLR